MTFKTSLFNKGLILNTVKRFWWVSALYGLLLFFMLPLRHMMLMMELDQDSWVKDQIVRSLDLTSHGSGLQILLILVIPVLMAVLVFNYIQKSNAASMVHSLPYTRKVLFLNHSITGFLLLAIPVIFNALVLILLHSISDAGGLKEYNFFVLILSWGGYTLLFNLLFFSITVFVGMFTGNSIAQIIFTYILHFLPVGIYILTRYNLSHLIHGYNQAIFFNPIVENYLPIFTLLNGRIGNDYLSIVTILTYIFVSFVFLFIAYYVYTRRKIESAGDIIAFRAIGHFFKYGVTFCSMLLGGAYFTSVGSGGFTTILFGYIFSSFIGYWIAQMIMEKSFRVWSAYKGYLAYTFIIVIVLIGIQMDITGFVNRVPEPDQVKEVYFGHLYEWQHIQKSDGLNNPKYGHPSGFFITEEDTIKDMISLHKELIQRRHFTAGTYGYRHLIYTLDDGSNLIRYYPFSEEAYASALMPIYASREYKEWRFPVLSQTSEDINKIEFKDYRSPGKSIVFSEKDEIEAFIKLLQNEIENISFEVLLEQTPHNATIIDNNGNPIDYGIRRSFTSVSKWLEENYDYRYKEAILSSDDVEYATIINLRSGSDGETVEVRDKEIIEELIEITLPFNHSYNEGDFRVDFHVEGRGDHLQHLDEDAIISQELGSFLENLP